MRPSVLDAIARLPEVARVTVGSSVREPGLGPRALADRIAIEQRLSPLGSAWRSIPRAEAFLLLRAVLHRDLAYRELRVPLSEAEQYASAVLDLVGEPAEYFTNGTWDELWAASPRAGSGTGTWFPCTGATFDTGVIAVGATQAVLVWVEDED